METREPPLEAVYRSSTKKGCLEYALVLKAAGIDHEVRRVAGEFILVVMASDALRARTELDAYAQENRDWPTRAVTIPHRAGGWGGVFCFAAVLLLVAALRDKDTFGFDWLAAGKTHAGLIRHGQWWRTVTALTLHSDLYHLLANVVFGGLAGLFASQLFGSGLAWISILAAGAVGNLLNAWIRLPDHTSIGASTAVFAALGLVAAYAWRRRQHLHTSRLARWAPLVGGLLLLSYLGAGGVRTDVTAHVTGFFSGVLLGALYGTLGDRLMLPPGAQFFLGTVALALLAFAWTLALTLTGYQTS